MKIKIRVHGKSQSRTALGIINAYLKLHPDATPYEVKRAFPKSLNRRCPLDNLIIPVDDTLGYEKLFFEHEDETIVFKNGARYALVELWDRDDFNAICEHAKQYGIEAAQEGHIKPFEKGSFELEDVEKCRFRWWCLLWLILLLILFLLLIFLCRKCNNDKRANPEKATIVDVMSNRQLITDYGTSVSIKLPDGNMLYMAKNSQEYKLFSFLNSPDVQVNADATIGWIPMDNIFFETGKADFLPESENQLKSIARIMQFFPSSRIQIGGYTDDTGTEEINMILSDGRAKATYERLVALGVAAYRMTYEGYGSNYPVNPDVSDDARAANRRVGVRVTRK